MTSDQIDQYHFDMRKMGYNISIGIYKTFSYQSNVSIVYKNEIIYHSDYDTQSGIDYTKINDVIQSHRSNLRSLKLNKI